MARLNITIPDDLYARLEQHRDQLNLSRICASALQEEMERLAGRPRPPDPAVTTLLLRLQGAFERWRGRGFADGRSWTAGQAGPQELRAVATEMATWSGEQLLAALEERRAYQAGPQREPAARPPLFPPSFDLDTALARWEAEDDTGDAAPTHQELFTYLEGWRDGVVDLWTAAQPLLRLSVTGTERPRPAAVGLGGAEPQGAGGGSGAGRSRTPAPAGWTAAGNKPANYEMRADTSVVYAGRASGLIRSKVDDPEHFGTLLQHFRADSYRGKRLRLSAYVKVEGVQGWAGLWVRVDDANTKALSFDNMEQRPIWGTIDWQCYEVVLDVPEEGEQIYFGVLLDGVGAAWVDEFRFEIVGPDVPVTASKAEARSAPVNLDFED